MICHKTGLPPISIMGFGLNSLSSEIRVPAPPAKSTTFISYTFPYYALINIGFIILISKAENMPCCITDNMQLSGVGTKTNSNMFYLSRTFLGTNINFYLSNNEFLVLCAPSNYLKFIYPILHPQKLVRILISN